MQNLSPTPVMPSQNRNFNKAQRETHSHLSQRSTDVKKTSVLDTRVVCSGFFAYYFFWTILLHFQAFHEFTKPTSSSLLKQRRKKKNDPVKHYSFNKPKVLILTIFFLGQVTSIYKCTPEFQHLSRFLREDVEVAQSANQFVCIILPRKDVMVYHHISLSSFKCQVHDKLFSKPSN